MYMQVTSLGTVSKAVSLESVSLFSVFIFLIESPFSERKKNNENPLIRLKWRYTHLL